mmetsp:Transcript_18156/g.23522  ORF Transcript_18156/g.23522 Transcript_18156/m.23522 type:complete len:216 (-) Transcript_18156:101-748(-)
MNLSCFLLNSLHASTKQGRPNFLLSTRSSSIFMNQERKFTSGPELPYPRAAVAITVRRRNPDNPSIAQYVLVQRKNDPGKGQWSLPGGKISLGENVLAAAKRELSEETGLVETKYSNNLKFSDAGGGAFGCSDAIYCRTSTINGIIVDFHYVISHSFAEWTNENESPILVANDDALDVKWWTREEIVSGHKAGNVSGNVSGVVDRAEALYGAGLL